MKKDKNISLLIKEIRSILLTEAKNTDIIVNKIGLPSEISEWLTNDYNEKFQLWIANNFKKEAVKRISGGKEIVANIMIKMLKGDKTQSSLKIQLNRQKLYFQGVFQLVVTWLQNRREISPEANAMGHCGQAGASGTLYSFRKNRQPYLTGEVNKINGVLVQLRGRANTKPKVEYHDRIMDFLLEPKVGVISFSPSTYRPDANFELKDLNLNQIIQLYSQKPTLFSENELYKVLLKYPDFATQVNFRVTPLHEDQKENFKRRYPNIQI